MEPTKDELAGHLFDIDGTRWYAHMHDANGMITGIMSPEVTITVHSFFSRSHWALRDISGHYLRVRGRVKCFNGPRAAATAAATFPRC